jgi:hypothetical protein
MNALRASIIRHFLLFEFFVGTRNDDTGDQYIVAGRLQKSFGKPSGVQKSFPKSLAKYPAAERLQKSFGRPPKSQNGFKKCLANYPAAERLQKVFGELSKSPDGHEREVCKRSLKYGLHVFLWEKC